MPTYITGWVDCPLLCSTGGTWGCCGAVAWGKGWPRTETKGHYFIKKWVHCV